MVLYVRKEHVEGKMYLCVCVCVSVCRAGGGRKYPGSQPLRDPDSWVRYKMLEMEIVFVSEQHTGLREALDFLLLLVLLKRD